MKRKSILLIAGLLLFVQSSAVQAKRFRVLVTNDDGVGAPGISAIVERLVRNHNLEITVVAPAKNRSGKGDDVTTKNAIQVYQTTTAGGYPATAVTGLPADAALFALRKHMTDKPDVVVSGINHGQNFMDAVEFSGTVGAALWSARLGIPAIAVSQGFGETVSSEIEYGTAAIYVANVVELQRTKNNFRQNMIAGSGLDRGLVININFPTCLKGALRGVKLVPLDLWKRITEYRLTADNDGKQTYFPIVGQKNYMQSADCTSRLADPATDFEALTNGFAAVTILSPTPTLDPLLRDFHFLESVGYTQ